MTDPVPTPPPSPPATSSAPHSAAPRYAWPKYVLAAIALFFTVCIVWTIKEVNRLKRAKEGGYELRAPAPTRRTN